MDEDDSSPETQAQNTTNPGLVSNVELSYVTLDMGRISESSIPKSVPGGEPITRESLKGGQIKVRVKTYSQSQPSEEEESDYEHEVDHETDQESHHRSNSSLPLLFPPHISDREEESIAPTTPPSTPRPTVDEESEEAVESNRRVSTQEQSVLEAEGSDATENIHHTLIEKECVVSEVLVVWEYICKFISQKMLEGFAVRIPGLGTFTHSVLPSDILKTPETGRFALRKSRKFPVFKICPHLKEMYRLIEDNYLYYCNAPIIPLNISVVASNAKMSRGIVDGIIVETLQSFVTGIITNKNLEFPFPFIGKLFVKQRKTFMIFYQQFCEGLSFDFNYAPSYISSVFPGHMTPLAYHRPSPQFHSVFHFCEVRSVEDKILARPRPYVKGNLAQGPTVSGDSCEFSKNLFNHSNLLHDCCCCKPQTIPKENQDYESDNGVVSTPPCGYSQSYDRIRKACCMQHGSFAFQKPDGSTFSPEQLYKTSKTGNPILDRLADDKCLLQQAIGCWMKRKVVQTLGKETVAKHYDREYFRRLVNNNVAIRGYPKKSSLVRKKEEELQTIASKDSHRTPDTDLNLVHQDTGTPDADPNPEHQDTGTPDTDLNPEHQDTGTPETDPMLGHRDIRTPDTKRHRCAGSGGPNLDIGHRPQLGTPGPRTGHQGTPVCGFRWPKFGLRTPTSTDSTAPSSKSFESNSSTLSLSLEEDVFQEFRCPEDLDVQDRGGLVAKAIKSKIYGKSKDTQLSLSQQGEEEEEVEQFIDE